MVTKVKEVMTEVEEETSKEGEDSSEDEFYTAHTSLAALLPYITSSESDTGTTVEHGDNKMVDDMGTLVIVEVGDDEMVDDMGMGTPVIMEDGEDKMVDDMGIGLLAITEDGEDDEAEKREEGRG